MSKIDQFESVFNAAAKTNYVYEEVQIKSVLVVTDLEVGAAEMFGGRTHDFLKALVKRQAPTWRIVSVSEYENVADLLALIEKEQPSLICSYRNLCSDAWEWPYSLGEYLDVMTQVISSPVVVLPHPSAERASEHAFENTDAVMAITDHLTYDHGLVNFSLALTEEAGRLFLTHIERQPVFERYVDVISKIPSIDTETAREELLRQLLKEPHDYIRSCRAVLAAENIPIKVEEIIMLGRRLEEYERLVEEREVDLLVMNTKDVDQLAMHGLAYPLAVELRQIPLLMI